MNPKETNMIILKIANMGEIKIELDYKNAPISSANFVSLVNKGYYDGLTFHRIINSAASSSSPNKVYQTVSVYQCYYIPDQDKYGNPRFDFRVKAEKGEPLFSGDNLSEGRSH